MFSGGLKLSDDDDDDFAVGNGSSISTLSNIFGVTIEASQNKDSPSLRYVSPKQNRSSNSATSTTTPKDTSSDSSQDWKVQVAKVVTAFKLLNQENISQGKIGLAILKHANEDLYRLLLYRSKTNVLSTCTLKDNVTIYRNNLYLQFHDDLQLFWSVLFDATDLDDALTYIGGKVKEVQQDNPIPNTVDEKNSVEPSPNVEALSELEKKCDENSSDEKLKQTKANILTRMAKMGQALPRFQGAKATTTDVSDSSDAESKVKISSKPIAATRKPKAQPLVPVATSGMQLVPSTSLARTIITTTGQGHSSIVPAADSQYMNILLAENRTQNSELRMNILKLETKIEKVLDKIDVIQDKSAVVRQESKEDEILLLEEKVLKLKKENRAQRLRIQELEKVSTTPIDESVVLEGDVSESIAAIDALRDSVQQAAAYRKLISKILSDQQPPPENPEKIVGLESEIQSLLEKLKVVQSEREQLTKSLNEQTAHFEIPVDDLADNSSLKNQLLNLRQISDSKAREETYYKIVCEMNDILRETRQSLETLESSHHDLSLKLAEQDQLMTSLKTNHSQEMDSLQQKLSDTTTLHDQWSKTEQIVKEIMNNLYQRLSEEFDKSDTFSSGAVLKVCAHAIKTETNNVLKKK